MTDIKLVESMIRNIIREEIQAAYAAIRNEMEQRIYEGKSVWSEVIFADDSKQALGEWFQDRLDDPEWVRENRAFIDEGFHFHVTEKPFLFAFDDLKSAGEAVNKTDGEGVKK